MENIAKKLDLPRRTWGMSCVLFHRTMLSYSPHHCNKLICATACVFLASKIDDNPRDLKLFSRLFLMLCQDPTSFNSKEKKASEAIINAEFFILQTTGFDFEIKLPYSILDENMLLTNHKDRCILFKKAETFLNECFRSNMCLFYQPSTLAAAALYMSSRFLRIDLQSLISKKNSSETEASTIISTCQSAKNGQFGELYTFKTDTPVQFLNPDTDSLKSYLLGKRSKRMSGFEFIDKLERQRLKKSRSLDYSANQRPALQEGSLNKHTLMPSEEWFACFGEDVTLEVLMSVSEKVYSQLKITKT